MLRKLYISGLTLVVVAGLAAQPVRAETPNQVLASIQNEAKTAPGSQEFSAARGANFFKTTHGNELSCASCHTESPVAQGKHAKTGKVIQPLAPSANAERFSDPAKVEKWFKRNCNDVLGRICTAQEKGDVLAYLLTVNK